MKRIFVSLANLSSAEFVDSTEALLKLIAFAHQVFVPSFFANSFPL